MIYGEIGSEEVAIERSLIEAVAAIRENFVHRHGGIDGSCAIDHGDGRGIVACRAGAAVILHTEGVELDGERQLCRAMAGAAGSKHECRRGVTLAHVQHAFSGKNVGGERASQNHDE